MATARILVVDDEKLIRWSMKEKLEKEGYEVFEAQDGEEAIQLINQELPDLILQDIKLPGISGLEILEYVKSIRPEALVIMMTAFGDVNITVKAMKLGAYDFLEKPFRFEKVKHIIAKALETVSLKQEVLATRSERQSRFSLGNIIGKTEAMQRVLQMVAKIAKSGATTVLLQGESGAGKDVIAKAIHYQSLNADAPFLEINCTSLPETLIESELFGHEKGAFTDAKAVKRGFFELADGGSIFLDEIGDMPLATQAKLLKVIESKTFKRLGGTKDIVVDVRIIAATNKNLEEGVKNGEFRQDLYYRLKVFPLYLPSLRERKADIPLLIEHFINLYNREFKKQVKGVSSEALKMMMDYQWPGNVRELKNVMERAIILESDEMILPEHLPPEISGPAVCAAVAGGMFRLPPQGLSLVEVERDLIQQALEAASGNQVKAATLLGMSRDTLRYRMKKFDLL